MRPLRVIRVVRINRRAAVRSGSPRSRRQCRSRSLRFRSSQLRRGRRSARRCLSQHLREQHRPVTRTPVRGVPLVSVWSPLWHRHRHPPPEPLRRRPLISSAERLLLGLRRLRPLCDSPSVTCLLQQPHVNLVPLPLPPLASDRRARCPVRGHSRMEAESRVARAHSSGRELERRAQKSRAAMIRAKRPSRALTQMHDAPYI